MRAAVTDVHAPLELPVPEPGPGEGLGPVNPQLPGHDVVLVVDADADELELNAPPTALNRYRR